MGEVLAQIAAIKTQMDVGQTRVTALIEAVQAEGREQAKSKAQSQVKVGSDVGAQIEAIQTKMDVGQARVIALIEAVQAEGHQKAESKAKLQVKVGTDV